MKEKVIETVKGQNVPQFHDRARRTEGGGEAPQLVEYSLNPRGALQQLIDSKGREM